VNNLLLSEQFIKERREVKKFIESKIKTQLIKLFGNSKGSMKGKDFIMSAFNLKKIREIQH
jgi:hypothetical protein